MGRTERWGSVVMWTEAGREATPLSHLHDAMLGPIRAGQVAKVADIAVKTHALWMMAHEAAKDGIEPILRGLARELDLVGAAETLRDLDEEIAGRAVAKGKGK